MQNDVFMHRAGLKGFKNSHQENKKPRKLYNNEVQNKKLSMISHYILHVSCMWCPPFSQKAC